MMFRLCSLRSGIHFIILFSAALLAACGAGEGSDGGTSATWEAPGESPAVAVEALEITRGYLIPYVESSGVIRGRNEVWVVSKTQGEITALQVKLGDKVERGDIILAVEDDVASLNADLARQQYESAQLDFEALESSFEKGGVSKSEYNRGKSRLLQTRTAYETAKEALRNTVIRSPISGSIAILEDIATPGNSLNPGTPVARIVDTSSLRMELSFGERQITLIEPGMPAMIEIESDTVGHPVEGVISAVGAGNNPQTGSFPAEVIWENPGGSVSLSGLRARVRIKVQTENPSIIIPASSVVIRDRTESVFVNENGTAVRRKIVTGEELGGRVTVKEGIDTGEILIISALTAIGDGYSVDASVIGKSGEWW